MRARSPLALTTLAVVLLSLLVGSPAVAEESDPGTIAPPGPGITRLAGPTRFETAIAASRLYAPGVPAVFVASGMNFPDALSAASAAANLGGPLLLTPTGGVPGSVISEIKRLAPQRILVAGGAGAVSDKAYRQLAALAPTTRLGGADRYSTGLRVVDAAFDAFTTAIIASGRSYPDALAATGAAGALDAPVVLVDGARSAAPAAAINALRSLGVTQVRIAGGTGAVSAGVESSLRANGFAVVRYAGSDRYATAASINAAVFAPGSSDVAVLAAGTNFPHALAGAAIAGRLGAPLYTAQAQCVPETIKTSLTRLGATRTVVMGGTAVVSDAAARNVACLVMSRPRIAGTAKIGATLTAKVGPGTPGANHAYQWFSDGTRIRGAQASTLAVSSGLGGHRITLRVTGSKPGYTTVVLTSAATAVVPRPAPAPAPVPAPVPAWLPGSGYSCPSSHPIKGNADSGIYHVPGGQYYGVTKPEQCFRTEGDAVAAGYRKSRR